MIDVAFTISIMKTQRGCPEYFSNELHVIWPLDNDVSSSHVSADIETSLKTKALPQVSRISFGAPRIAVDLKVISHEFFFCIWKRCEHGIHRFETVRSREDLHVELLNGPVEHPKH